MLAPRLLDALRAIAGEDGVIARPTELRVYECDGYTLEKSAPVVQILRLLERSQIAFVPRGAGTGLSGGCYIGPSAVFRGAWASPIISRYVNHPVCPD
jgi:FAD/FMN-containing dehydrogenase